MRVARLSAIVLVALAAAQLAACGGDQAPHAGVTATSPSPSSPRGTPGPTATAASVPPAAATGTGPLPGVPAPQPPRSTPPLGRAVTKNGVALMPIAAYGGHTQLAVRASTIAIAAPVRGGAQLMVSTGGAAPRPAVGAGLLPSWAQPHVGSAAGGKPVVSYPRCINRRLVTCDVYSWDPSTRRERRLAAVSSAAPETEAVLDDGNVLVVRERMTRGVHSDLPTTTTELYRPRGGRLRILTHHGGRNIDLEGSRSVDTFTGGGGDSLCGVFAVRLFNVETSKVAHSQAVTCDLNGSQVVASSLAKGHVEWAVHNGSDADQIGMVFDYDPATAIVRHALIHHPFDAWAAEDSAGTGLILEANVDFCTSITTADDAPITDDCQLSRLSGLDWSYPVNRR